MKVERTVEVDDDTGEELGPVSYTLDDIKLPGADWEMVDPVMAHEALSNMRKNRPLREPRVDAIVDDIKNRRWRLTGEAVQQGDDGKWDNGQHRFTAIYRAGIAVPMLVVRGMPADARIVLDSGTPRRYSDVRSMRGETNTSVASAVIRRMWFWDVQRSYIKHGGGRISPSHQTLDAYASEHAEEIELALAMKSFARRCWLSPTVLATVHILLRRIDKAGAARFLEGVITGAELKFTDPRRALRDKLRDLHEKGDGTPDETRAWVFMAWNHWRSNNELARLVPPRGGSARQPFTDKNYPLPYA